MKAVDKYVKNNYDSVLVRVPKGRKATIEACAAASGEKVNAMLNRLLREAAGLTEEEWKKAPDTTGGGRIKLSDVFCFYYSL